MSPKRLASLAVIALVATVVVSTKAVAGVGIADDPCPTVAGENTNTCPAGTVGVPYSIRFHEAEGSGCGPGLQTFAVDSGVFPPGLSLASDGLVTGSPTEAGVFTFYIRINEPLPPTENCAGSQSEKRFTIPVNPGVARLVIGPEQSGVPVATVSSPYSLQMTASVSDPKTWSVAAGALPAGLTLGSANGLISGTPTAAGTSTFTVRAEIDPQRVDTKTLAITVRDRVAIGTAVTPPSEVGVAFLMPLTATGGTGTFTWAVTAGALPAGLALTTTGAIAGRPTQAGGFGFTVTATDAEGRTGAYPTTLTVAARIAVAPQRLRPAQVGRFYQVRLQTTGGVQPMIWRVKRGPLPRGMHFDRQLGLLYGAPTRARTYRMQFEVQDALRVKATGTVTLVVKAAPKPKPKKRR